MVADELRVEPARALVGHIAAPDFALAAPFVVAATLLSGSELTAHDVPLEPSRTRLLDVLARMGGRVAIFNRRRAGGPVADVEVHAAPLVAATVDAGEAAAVRDELALLVVAAGSARGETVVRARDEALREWAESVSIALRPLGIRAAMRDNGLGVRGVPTRPKGGGMDPLGDSRLEVAGVIAGLVSREGVRVRNPGAAAVSLPGFFDLLESVTQR